MRLAGEEVLALHRKLVSIPSVSGNEGPIADWLQGWLAERGTRVERLGASLLATVGQGPVLLLDTHLDTVPPAPGWTADPFTPRLDGGRVIGLGANDAKAAAAAMAAAFVAFLDDAPPFTLALALVEGEETRSVGTESVLAHLAATGRTPRAAVVGEPTGLDLAVAQKGMLVLELVAHGEACHAAHAATLGAANAARRLARDLVALEALDLGPTHPWLGATTLEPTVVRAGEARNVVPAHASAILDVRTTPALSPAEVVARIEALIGGELRVASSRLAPRETPEGAPVLRAALAARPGARTYGSATLSDWALLDGVPAIKCGPGRSERSHTADEFVLEEEVLDGASFYVELVRQLAALPWVEPEKA